MAGGSDTRPEATGGGSTSFGRTAVLLGLLAVFSRWSRPEGAPGPTPTADDDGQGRGAMVLAVLAVLLLAGTFLAYRSTARTARTPLVDGRAYLFVEEGMTDAVVLTATVDAVAGAARHPQVTIGIDVRGPAIDWALVLVGDARLDPSTTTLQEGARAYDTDVADPPVVSAATRPAQTIVGRTRPSSVGRSGAIVQGRILAEVRASDAAGTVIVLPTFGRAAAPEPTGPEGPGAAAGWDLDVGGEWVPPEDFSVVVTAGLRPAAVRVDVESPPLLPDDTEIFTWVDDVRVTRPTVLFIDPQAESTRSGTLFILGVVGGLGGSALVAAAQMGLGRRRRLSRLRGRR